MRKIKERQKGRKDTATVSVVITKDDYESLIALSERQGISMSSIVRGWIRSKLK